ncbi:MAG: tRNA (adenosine(37)-N6)-threonylcarbamoyltransferase complex ATPase subunit type 1 TsaE [Abditibacteriota bacterium]|nr:tRNA (adenosine(37)-N6)-threonylcarbamoyltransferase complex ATPase subunit type 1 TsaE [Abditibacteriota bacterium]
MNITTNSPEETVLLAEVFASCISAGELILFFGDLGAGKTTFTKGFAKALGIADGVHSPTFTLIHEHEGAKKLYHIDLYRLETQEEIDGLGLEEYLVPDAITLIEWSERFRELPENHIIVKIETTGETRRSFTFSSDHLDDPFFEAMKKEYQKRCIF